MDESERLERERLYVQAAEGGDISRDVVQDLHARAHGILKNKVASRDAYIAAAESKVSRTHSRQSLNGSTYDVYISSRFKDENDEPDNRVRFLFLPKGKAPELVKRDGTMLITNGGKEYNLPSILIFDVYGDQWGEHINHPIDIDFAHSVITDIQSQSEELQKKRVQERKDKVATSLVLLGIGGVMFSHNVIGERDTPRWAPAPVEWFVDGLNMPDHKATGFDDPSVEIVTIGEKTELPSLTTYNTGGAPRTWNEWEEVGNEGDKPGLWRLSLDRHLEEEIVFDKDIVEERIQSTFEQFECSASMSGEDCIEALQDEFEDIEQLSSSQCRVIDIEILPGAQLFTTTNQAMTYEITRGETLEICSEIGTNLSGTDVYVYNRR